MIRPIRTDGDPILRAVSREVTPEELATPALQLLIDDLIATLKSTAGVGLAAPQVGESLRIVLVDKPLTVLVNPIVTPVTDTTDTSFEGCLSVPGMRGEVRRPQTVRVQALDRHGKAFDMVWTKFRAIVAQHEADHLDGILYTDRTTVMFTDDAAPPRREELRRDGTGADATTNTVTGKKKTIVVDSEKKVGGKQFVSFTFHERGRMTDVRITPGGAIVLGAWLSGVRLRQKGYKAGAAATMLVGEHGLHVARGDQLRLELQMPSGKRRLQAEADWDG